MSGYYSSHPAATPSRSSTHNLISLPVELQCMIIDYTINIPPFAGPRAIARHGQAQVTELRRLLQVCRPIFHITSPLLDKLVKTNFWLLKKALSYSTRTSDHALFARLSPALTDPKNWTGIDWDKKVYEGYTSRKQGILLADTAFDAAGMNKALSEEMLGTMMKTKARGLRRFCGKLFFCGKSAGGSTTTTRQHLDTFLAVICKGLKMSKKAYLKSLQNADYVPRVKNTNVVDMMLEYGLTVQKIFENVVRKRTSPSYDEADIGLFNHIIDKVGKSCFTPEMFRQACQTVCVYYKRNDEELNKNVQRLRPLLPLLVTAVDVDSYIKQLGYAAEYCPLEVLDMLLSLIKTDEKFKSIDWTTKEILDKINEAVLECWHATPEWEVKYNVFRKYGISLDKERAKERTVYLEGLGRNRAYIY